MCKRIPQFFFVGVLCLGSCSKNSNSANPITPIDTIKKDTSVKKDSVITGVYSTIVPDTTIFNRGVQMGTLNDPLIQSASGLAASRAYPNMFWTHDDAGKNGYVFLLDSTGKRKNYYQVTNGVNSDWTDMTIGPGPTAGVTYIYLADVGDSKVNRSYVTVQRFPEPTGVLDTTGNLGVTPRADHIAFKYPDGPRDAETILLDPLTKDIYIISKNTPADIYVAKYPQKIDTIFTIKKLATIPLVSLRGGGMSSNGQEILAKDLYTIYYWKRKAGDSVLSILLRTPVTLPYNGEDHGEAICWSVGGDSYWTTSKVQGPGIPDFTVYRKK